MERVEVKASLVWLASYLEQFCEVTYVDLELEIGRPNSATMRRRFERQVRHLLASAEYDLLAISCWTSLSYRASLEVARAAREIDSSTPIVVGGYHPTARPNDFATPEQLFDYVVTGEGEHVLRELVAEPTLQRPSKPTVINGRTVTADDFVSVDWGYVDTLAARHFPDGIDNVYMYLSRGCPFGCSFCMEPMKDRRWRAYDPVESVNMVCNAAARFKARAVALADACFGMRPGWRRTFLSEMVRRNPDFWIVLETRPEYLDETDMDLLSHLKVEVQFGLESGSSDILRLMNKTKQPAKYLDCFRRVSTALSERKVLHRANMIFNHPGETEATLRETFEFIDSMLTVRESYLMWASHVYMHFPGCDLDFNRSRYETEFGTTFDCGDWWRRDDDQYEASMRTAPSRDLSGERAGLWKEMLDQRESAIRDSLALPAFKFAATKYFQHWKTDARYHQTQAVA